MMQKPFLNMLKIAIIYEYGDESWSTPYSLIKEFINRGHTVVRFHLTKNLEYLHALSTLHFDIMITMDFKGIDIPQEIHTLIPKSTLKIRECADTPQRFFNHLPLIRNYDLLLTPDYISSMKYSAFGIPCLWSNHFADTQIHKRYQEQDDLAPVRSTRGQGGSELMDRLHSIMPDKFINQNGLIGEQYGKFLSSGKIVLQNSRWQEITRRIFEGMACGKLVITDRLPESTRIYDLFEEDKDIVFYNDLSELISKINYYLSPEGASVREYIADNGYQKVLREHTQYNRVNEIIEAYYKWKN